MRVTKSNGFDKVSAPHEFNTLQELAEFITNNDWSPFVYQTEHEDQDGTFKRNRKSFCAADIFALDIDDGLSLVDAINIIKQNGLAAIIAPSRSHQKVKGEKPACDRYRIIFKLNESIYTESQVKSVFFALKKLFPSADDACKDAARLYYASPQIALIQEGNSFQVPAIVQEITTTKVVAEVVDKDVEPFPLSKASLNTIASGAEAGKRNTALTALCHDAIQQRWSKEKLLKLLRTSEHTWLYDNIALTKIDERYQNFTPTHAPRLPSERKPSTKPEFIPLNQIKPLMIKWLEDNQVAVSFNRTIYLDNKPLIAEDIVRKIVLHLSAQNFTLSEHVLEYTLHEWVEEKRNLHLEMVVKDLSGFDLQRGREECHRFLSVFSSTVTDLDVEILRHMIWQVKRKLQALPTKYEMMLVFSGGQGAGKSFALRELLFKPLGDLVHKSAGFEALADARESRLFADHYVCFFDEMSGAHKAEMERVKQIITSGTIKQRRMGTTSHDTMPMNSTFFGASNPPLEMLIRDQTGMRRFWEIKVDPAVITRPRWPQLKVVDIKAIWQSADVNDPESPIESRILEVQEQQEGLRDKSIYEWLLAENIIELTDNLDEFTSALALTHVVNVAFNQHSWSSKSLAKEWSRANIPKIRTGKGTSYGVKIVDADVLHTIRTKYNLRVNEKDKEGYQF